MDAPGGAPLPDAAFFRAAWGRIVGVLVRSHRLADPSAAEDAAQHAMLQALRLWPAGGVPDAPLAWLTTVARHHLADHWRHGERALPWDALPPEAEPAVTDTPVAPGELGDDELALLFACCDPALPLATQVALALKVLCGFSLREIAAGLLDDAGALAQRLARARRVLASRAQPIGLPAGPELATRREAALHAIHLLFNEGYAASEGDDAQRPDLCREATRLARALAAHPAATHPDAHALAALLLFHGARLGSRVDAAGDWRLLQAQDRATWDRGMIAMAYAHLERAQQAEALSAWVLRAGIAAEHASAPRAEDTPWAQIAAHYALLVRLDPSPATRLAQAVAVGEADGAVAGLAAVDAVLPALTGAVRVHGLAARAHHLVRLGRAAEATEALREALAIDPPPAARRLLERRLAETGGG